MPTYQVDVHLKGTLNDDGIDIEELKVVPPSRLRRALTWFWELDIKAKLFFLALLAAGGYALRQVYVTGDWRQIYLSLKPVSDRVIEVIQGILTG